METSFSLTKLINYAQRYDKKGGEKVTIAAFVLTVFEALRGNDRIRFYSESEKSDSKDTFEKYGLNISDVKTEKIMLKLKNSEYVVDSSGGDDLRIALDAAMKKAKSLGRGQITTDILLECIFQEPSIFLNHLREFASDSESDEGAATLSKALASSRGYAESVTKKAGEVCDFLSEKIYGQENAIKIFSSGFFNAKMASFMNKDEKRPLGIFLFAGPPGVGKTYMVKCIRKALEMEDKSLFLDMSEFSDDTDYMDLIGYGNNYKNPEEGQLTSFVEKNPQCLLLFDEIEKAHETTIKLFLQILEEGELIDRKTQRAVSFKDALIFFTTNAGKKLYNDSDSFDLSGFSKEVIMDAIRKELHPATRRPLFPAAICSRFASGNVALFNHLSAKDLLRIARSELEEKAKRFDEKFGIRVEFTPGVFSALLYAEGGAPDARALRSHSEDFFNAEIYELFRLISSEEHIGNISKLDVVRFDIDIPEDKEISSLFTNNKKHEVMIFASKDTVKKCTDLCTGINFVGANSIKSAKNSIKNGDIAFAIIDMKFGTRGGKEYINTEDIDSSARDTFWYIHENYPRLPIYIFQREDSPLSREEQRSFLNQGVRGFMTMDDEGSGFKETVIRVCEELYQQSGIIKLARSNKIINYETGQRISDDGKTAEIILFDFELSTAVQAEDVQNIMSSISKPDVTFEEIIGAENAKEELQFFIDYLKDPKKYAGTGLRAPHGVLLYGPPGTGKTLLAKAVAAKSGVTFISTEGNRFIQSSVGEGKNRLHELFSTARKYAPTIIFIDEFESIAIERRGGYTGEDVLTALLTEMDGFNTDVTRPVFVLAATNFDVTPGSGKSLDQALLRRFDSKIYVDLPNREERIRFIKKKCEKNRAFQISDSEIDNIALRSTGMSLADLDSIMDLSLRRAIRNAGTIVTDSIFDEAFETFCGGEEKEWDDSQLERTARHEAGHAVLCWYGGNIPSYITVVSRGNYGGYMSSSYNESKMTYTVSELYAFMRVSLGGRASEIVYYGETEGLSTGASGDLERATRIARQIICLFGMDKEFGLAVVDSHAAENGEISLKVRETVNRMLDKELEKTIEILKKNKDVLDALSEKLIAANYMNGDEIKSILESYEKK